MRATIRRVKYAEIAGAENARELIEEYAAECSVPINPQTTMYERMEEAGALTCFGLYEAESGKLAGFASLLTAVMPHSGMKVATLESIFINAKCRPGASGLALLEALETEARASGCTALLYNVRTGSEIERILARRAGCRMTHTGYTRWLQ